MEPQVETAAGRLQGAAHENYLSFKGIPFAAPPVGKRRFLPPQPVEPWTGVRRALAYGSAPLQRPSGVPFMDAGVPLDEDCLFLNVFTPSPWGSRPVLLWIHGGGFNLGAGSQAGYEGGPLVTRGDVVLVTTNYRLGMLGYMYLGEHGGDAWGASANLGQLDQIAALRWIRENIASFGGDPNNVTIFGESAGSAAVAALLAMPEARGLFQRAIGQSGTANSIPRAPVAAEVTQGVLAQLGLSADNSQRLQEAPSRELFKAERAALEALGASEGRPRRGFWPVVDGKTLPVPPLQAVQGGAARGIPLIFGTNRDEDKFSEAIAGRRADDFDDETLRRRVARLLGRNEAHASALIEVYRQSRRGRDLLSENRDILSAIATDQRQRMPAIRLIEAQRAHEPRTYNYLFCYEQPALKAAIHGLEIPFVFGKIGTGRDAMMATHGGPAEQLSRVMLGAWTRFARSGDPALPELPWAPYDTARRATMVYGEISELVDAPFEEERAAWDALR